MPLLQNKFMKKVAEGTKLFFQIHFGLNLSAIVITMNYNDKKSIVLPNTKCLPNQGSHFP